eukprot:CAMPEP_0113530690 /NCGR_PEP_ID=MMETSP0015_2-20120614/3081_1 /TAXON_ID=2838 /ORGANISM="Odontella" /LENGTH=675 /DNA_ID=CAMNT_0000429443 /DNA_START=696 /DNA_END=2723 /DNA_ORIENTATION=+ /assembly_acc=CAM_ASM_000160
MGGLSKSKSCLHFSHSGPSSDSGSGPRRERERERGNTSGSCGAGGITGNADRGPANHPPPQCSLLGQSLRDAEANRTSSTDYVGELVETALYLPPVQEGEVDRSGGSPGRRSRERLYLPRRGSAPCSLDEYLRNYVPRVASRAEDLLNRRDDELLLRAAGGSDAAGEDDDGGDNSSSEEGQPVQLLGRTTSLLKGEALERRGRTASFLNVLQGEVAHASADQADVVVSAEATTCHVVALRSTSGKRIDDSSETNIAEIERKRAQPLVSVAHVDAAGEYDACLEAMVKEHIDHHERARPQRHRQQNKAGQPKAKRLGLPHHAEEEQEDEYGFFYNDDEGSRMFPSQAAAALGPMCQSSSPPSFLPSSSSPPSFLPRLAESETSMLTVSPTCYNQNIHQDEGTDHHEDENDSKDEGPIEMELHMVGGYLDHEGLSQSISSSLLTTFSDVAKKYENKVRISLSSAAISCMNTTTVDNEDKPANGASGIPSEGRVQDPSVNAAPRSRGLGIDTRTGRVFPVRSSLPSHLEGPAVDVRSARAFAHHDDDDCSPQAQAGQSSSMPRSRSLAVIHDSASARGEIRVNPFHYRPNPQLDVLLRVPDEILLKVASTSPQCESDNFCRSLRRAVSFVNTVPQEEVFASVNDGNKDELRPLVFARSTNNLNEWERVSGAVATSAPR